MANRNAPWQRVSRASHGSRFDRALKVGGSMPWTNVNPLLVDFLLCLWALINWSTVSLNRCVSVWRLYNDFNEAGEARAPGCRGSAGLWGQRSGVKSGCPAGEEPDVFVWKTNCCFFSSHQLQSPALLSYPIMHQFSMYSSSPSITVHLGSAVPPFLPIILIIFMSCSA